MPTQHTPGPFRRPDRLTITGRYQIPQGLPAVMGGYPVICTLEDQPDVEGNARLIAASPELLASIQSALRIEALWCPPDSKDDPEREGEYDALRIMRTQFKAAIAKATGEE